VPDVEALMEQQAQDKAAKQVVDDVGAIRKVNVENSALPTPLPPYRPDSPWSGVTGKGRLR